MVPWIIQMKLIFQLKRKTRNRFPCDNKHIIRPTARRQSSESLGHWITHRGYASFYSHHRFWWKQDGGSTEATGQWSAGCLLMCSPESRAYCGDSRLFGSQCPEKTGEWLKTQTQSNSERPDHTDIRVQVLTGFFKMKLFCRAMRKAVRPNFSFSLRPFFHQASHSVWMWSCRCPSETGRDTSTSGRKAEIGGLSHEGKTIIKCETCVRTPTMKPVCNLQKGTVGVTIL